MPHTVEAKRRAVSLVLDLEEGGVTRAEASRRVASQGGLPLGRLRRWLDVHDAASGELLPGGRAASAPVPAPARAVPRIRAVAAGATALAVGADVVVKFPLTSTTVLAVVLLPVWVPVLRRYRGAAALVVLGLAAVLCGTALAALTTEHEVDPDLALATGVAVLSGAGAIGVLLWVRSVVGTEVMAVLVGLGMLVAVGLDGINPVNAWKYQLSLPVTTVLLALVARRSPVLSAGVLVALAVVGLANDSRSYAGFAVLTAAVVLWQVLSPRTSGERRRPWQRVLLGVLLVMGLSGASAIGQSLLVGGALGEEVQARSAAQVTAGGGSLLAGGRPELMATRELVPAHPWGFGLGVVPNQPDVLLAKKGMAEVGIRPGNGYVDNYMFGGHIELHSVIADLWAQCGVVGAVFGFALAWVLVDALLADAGTRRSSALSVFWVASAVWFLGFGPLYSNLPDIAFAVAVVIGSAAGARKPHRRRSSTSSWGPLQTTPPAKP